MLRLAPERRDAMACRFVKLVLRELIDDDAFSQVVQMRSFEQAEGVEKVLILDRFLTAFHLQDVVMERFVAHVAAVHSRFGIDVLRDQWFEELHVDKMAEDGTDVDIAVQIYAAITIGVACKTSTLALKLEQLRHGRNPTF